MRKFQVYTNTFKLWFKLLKVISVLGIEISSNNQRTKFTETVFDKISLSVSKHFKVQTFFTDLYEVSVIEQIFRKILKFKLLKLWRKIEYKMNIKYWGHWRLSYEGKLFRRDRDFKCLVKVEMQWGGRTNFWVHFKQN